MGMNKIELNRAFAIVYYILFSLALILATIYCLINGYPLLAFIFFADVVLFVIGAACAYKYNLYVERKVIRISLVFLVIYAFVNSLMLSMNLAILACVLLLEVFAIIWLIYREKYISLLLKEVKEITGGGGENL